MKKTMLYLAETNHAVGNATVNIVKGWMPFFARPFVLPVMKCLLDKNMLKALGYPDSSFFAESIGKWGNENKSIRPTKNNL